MPSDLVMFPPHVGDPASLWADFTDDPEPSNRDRLIFLTMREVAIVGPASFNTAGVCDALGISYPMVNYYFGNRDGLIAEAAHATYVRYETKIWQAVEAAPRTPVDRLRAYLYAHLRLNIEIRGWGAVLNYPIFSASIAQLLDERFGDEHRAHFELNMARLVQLVRDLWSGDITDFAYGVGDYPREELLPDVRRSRPPRHCRGEPWASPSGTRDGTRPRVGSLSSSSSRHTSPRSRRRT